MHTTAHAPFARDGRRWRSRWLSRQRAPGRLERVIVGTGLWLIAALALIGLVALAAALLLRSGVPPKSAELVLGLATVPAYLLVRAAWRRVRLALLPTELDLFFLARGRLPPR